jgi:hypothetical protein
MIEIRCFLDVRAGAGLTYFPAISKYDLELFAERGRQAGRLPSFALGSRIQQPACIMMETGTEQTCLLMAPTFSPIPHTHLPTASRVLTYRE